MGSFMFYAGMTMLAFSLVSGIAALVLLRKEKKALEKNLNEEYGKKA